MEINLAVDDTLTPGISRALAASHDFSPAMAAIAATLRAAVEARFEAEAGPDGAAWKPSARVLEKGGKTLQLRGLRGGLLGNLLGGAGHDAASAWIGTNLVYAAIHQLGGTIRARPKSQGGKGYLWIKGKHRADGSRLTVASVSMPARPFLGFSDADRAGIADILGRHLRDAFEGGAA